MTDLAVIGRKILRRQLSDDAFQRFSTELVRDLNSYQRMIAVRAVCFMSEQTCPFEEEFDGNDLTCTHFLVYDGKEAVGTLRLRWFAAFGKVERVCVLPHYRGTDAVRVLLSHAFEFAARKGYQLMIAQIQARLWPVWSRMLHCQLRAHRPRFTFSDYDYLEIDLPVPEHPQALLPDSDPYLIIRPEGDWDREGVLERSLQRLPAEPEPANVRPFPEIAAAE